MLRGGGKGDKDAEEGGSCRRGETEEKNEERRFWESGQKGDGSRRHRP